MVEKLIFDGGDYHIGVSFFFLRMVDRACPLSHQPQLEMIGIKQAPSPINTLPGFSSQIPSIRPIVWWEI